MARLYTKLSHNTITLGHGAPFQLGFNLGASVPAHGELWVIRDISGVVLEGVTDRIRFGPSVAGVTTPAWMFDFAWTALTLPARSPAFHWSGHLVMPPGQKFWVHVMSGNASFTVSGWSLRVPPTTTPIPT